MPFHKRLPRLGALRMMRPDPRGVGTRCCVHGYRKFHQFGKTGEWIWRKAELKQNTLWIVTASSALLLDQAASFPDIDVITSGAWRVW